MKKRVLTGIGYVVVLLSFYALKLTVSDYCFDVLIWLLAIIGTFEMARACNVTPFQQGFLITFAVCTIPAYVVLDLLLQMGYWTFGLFFIVYAIFLLSTIVFRYEETTLDNLGKCMLTLVYPNVFLFFLVAINHMGEYGLPLFFPFAVTPLTDVFAFQTGSALHKKFPQKLSPAISPNKTIVGGIGGLFGGMISSALLFLLWYFLGLTHLAFWNGLGLFVVFGLFISIATQVGDLVESAIKRKANIKDMGNCLPGHGGILDRIDSTLYTSVITYLVFVLIS